MKLKRVDIHNYKSLRNISIEPSSLTVLVGPNASGKSNFCDALDFLGEVYQLGLEVAVARKGGYENICFRRMRRSKAPIEFRIRFQVTLDEFHWPLLYSLRYRKGSQRESWSFFHSFSIRTESTNIQAPFYIDNEKFELGLKGRGHSDSELMPILSASRKRNKIHTLNYGGLERIIGGSPESQIVSNLFADFSSTEIDYELPETELLLTLINRVFLSAGPFRETIGSLRVFQLSPRNCRESGVPTPNPELTRFGSNLPAMIEFLKNQHPRRYQLLLDTVKRVMPTLQELDTQYTHRKTLGLLVAEKGFGRPWAAEDVSDGTIQSIALLVAIFDPRTRIVVIEEPENSVHPWAIRQFVEAAREVSESKHIVFTTHSPILIDQLKPEELWIVQRPGADTMIDRILDLDPSVFADWGKGEFSLSEYLDSGALSEAVPSE